MFMTNHQWARIDICGVFLMIFFDKCNAVQLQLKIIVVARILFTKIYPFIAFTIKLDMVLVCRSISSVVCKLVGLSRGL